MNKAPWQHALSAKLDHLPKVRPTYQEAAKQVRNRLRRYSAESIVHHAIACLHMAHGKAMLEEMRTWPWVTLLLVKLVLEDDTIALTRGERCSPEVFDRCRQTLWDAQGAPDRKEASPGGVYLMLRSMTQAQLPFQKKISWDFLRWPALIARLPADHPSRRHFAERLGMEPESFLQLCYAAYVPVVNGDRAMRLRDFERLRHRHGSDVDRFFTEFSNDLQALRAELQRLRSARLTAGAEPRPRHEINEFPWLANYPLLRLPGDNFQLWHPAVFARGMEQGVHKRLSERRGAYADHFSKVFEDYVIELLGGSGLRFLSEADYKRALASDQNAVEAIVTDQGANVFIESKLTAYSEYVALSHRSPMVWTGLKRVREAMHQGWMVSSRLRAAATPDWECTKAAEDFLIVVTSQPVSCATGEHFRRMFKHDVFDPERLAGLNVKTPTSQQLSRLPLRNIVVASIEEFEHLMGCIKQGEITLVPFLREVAAANADPRTSVMFLDQLLGTKTRTWPLSPLLERAQHEAESALLDLLR